ncbi:MAG: AraC family transcriptional regulator [Hungatella sp.]|nr:AraC family transcriptional regulator [Hungatella sp.]
MNHIEYKNYQEKKNHGSFSFPYTTYPCSIPLDFPRVPLHWHDEMEIIYIKKGQGVVTVDFITLQAAAGDILIIIPGQLHSIDQAPGQSMEYENIIFHTDMLFFRQEDICAADCFLPLLRRQLEIPSCLSRDLEFYKEAAACLDEADRLCQHRPFAYQLSVKAQLFQFFYILFSHSVKVPSGVSKNRALDKAKLILKYIENHYTDNLSIKEMAEACGFSQSHFMKFFKASFGASFVTYLKEYRLTMAARLLLSSSVPVLAVAQETGFDNLSYFNRSFKAMYGVTPRQFRQGG